MTTCPLCRMKLMGEPRAFGESVEYKCYNCGVFRLSGTTASIVAKAAREVVRKFQSSFYSDPVVAVFKAPGVE